MPVFDSNIDLKSNWDAAMPWCRYFNSLFMDFRWIARRVETVSMTDIGHWNHYISLDIDMKELEKRAIDSGLTDFTELPIPLDTLRKGLLIEFDVTDHKGHTKSIKTSDVDSRIAQLALCGQLEDKPSDVVMDALLNITQRIEINDDWKKEGFCNADFYKLISEKDAEGNLVQNDFRELLARFSANFPLITSIKIDQDEPVLKYHFIEVAKLLEENPLRRFLKTNTPFVYKNPRVGEAQREHLHIIAPDGAEFSYFPIPFVDNTNNVNDKVGCEPEFKARTTPECLSIYSKATISDADRYRFLISMRPKVKGFIDFALFGFLLSLLIITVFFVWQVFVLNLGFFDKLRLSGNTMPVVTLLQFIPNLLLLKAWDNEKSTLSRKMLSGHRWLIVFSSAIVTLSCAFLIAGFPCVPVLWLLILLINLTGFIFLSISRHRSKSCRRLIIENMHETITLCPQKL